jgi:hypothetical protein
LYPLSVTEKRRVYSAIGLFLALAGIHGGYLYYTDLF